MNRDVVRAPAHVLGRSFGHSLCASTEQYKLPYTAFYPPFGCTAYRPANGVDDICCDICWNATYIAVVSSEKVVIPLLRPQAPGASAA